MGAVVAGSMGKIRELGWFTLAVAVVMGIGLAAIGVASLACGVLWGVVSDLDLVSERLFALGTQGGSHFGNDVSDPLRRHASGPQLPVGIGAPDVLHCHPEDSVRRLAVAIDAHDVGMVDLRERAAYPERLAGDPRVLGGHEVGMGPSGPGAGELEHRPDREGGHRIRRLGSHQLPVRQLFLGASPVAVMGGDACVRGVHDQRRRDQPDPARR